MELRVFIPEQRVLHIREQPSPDGAGYGRRIAGGKNRASVLIQQGQTDGRSSKQPVVSDIDRNQSRAEYCFKKQNGNNTDADRYIALPRQRYAANIGDDIREQARTEEQWEHFAAPVFAPASFAEEFYKGQRKKQE